MPLPLRSDFDAAALRVAARRSKHAAIYDGATRTEAARIGGVTLQIVRIGPVSAACAGASLHLKSVVKVSVEVVRWMVRWRS